MFLFLPSFCDPVTPLEVNLNIFQSNIYLLFLVTMSKLLAWLRKTEYPVGFDRYMYQLFYQKYTVIL